MSDETKTREDVFTTWKSATFSPKKLYEDPPRERTSPLVLAVMVGTVAAIASALVAGGLAGAVGMAILAPFGTVVSVYLTAAVVHFWLVVLRGRKGTFKDTAAAVGFAHAPLIFGVVPLAGPIVGNL
jgi:hypothetical protein